MNVAKPFLWRGFYELLGRWTRHRGAGFSTMNFGYDDGRALVDPAEIERFSLQLYARLVDGLDLAGKRVVDASCGRGGGLAWIHANRGPASCVGVDLAPVNVSLSGHTFRTPGLTFMQGSATRLPLPDASADLVLSVEASHCYGDVDAFLAEAARVVSDDGVVCWTDFEKAGISSERRAAVRARFGEADEVDIGERVLRALDADRERRRGLVRAHTARVFWPALDHFAGASAAADTYRRFAEKRSVYFLRRLRRPLRNARG